MKNILLILSTSKTSNEAIEYAIKTAKDDGAKLIALYIIETKLTSEVFDRVTDIGFIGDKPSSQLAEAIVKEYRQRGYEELGRVQVRAIEESVDFDAVTTHGDFLEKALEVVDRYKADLIVTVERKRSTFLKYFSESKIGALIEKAPCKVEAFEET